MKTSQFSFDLPPDLIAQEPLPDREASRLLVLDRASGGITHSSVHDVPSWIAPGSLLVFNDSRVRKARLFGRTESGGAVEVLLLRRREPGLWEALAGKARRLRAGKSIIFPEGVRGALEGNDHDVRLVRFSPDVDDAYLERNGHVPLPPYIKRGDTPEDSERYQTVYSRPVGSAAAPTAGLHFTPALISRLEAAGVETARLTLHVGLGTFLPIRTEEIEDHRMHEESFSIPAETCARVNRAVEEKRPVIAVGTTSVRALESAWTDRGLITGESSTRIFIYPGYRFRVVNGMFTNFHTPGSSLLALVCAFAGRERILGAYAEAVALKYRFFSYGDAMLIR